MNRSYTSVRLEITSRCNLNCTYCHNSRHSNSLDDMTTDEILSLVRNLKQVYGVNKILLTGGEPLIKKDICYIIEAITSYGIKVDLVTNGTLITEELLAKLEAAGLKRIRISIDEVGTVTAARDGTNPNELWDIAKMVKDKSNIELCIHTVCSPYNAQALFDVYEKVLEVGAARWRVFDLGFQGGVVDDKSALDLSTYYSDIIGSTKKILAHYLENNLKDVLEIEINNIFRTAFLDMNPDDFKTFSLAKTQEDRFRLSPCNYVTQHQITVRSNGIGTLCQYFFNPIFEYKKHSFDVQESIANANECIENELQISDLSYCSKCKYCLVCNSGCRARANFLTGDIKDADPGACYLHPMVHKEIMSMLPQYVREIYDGYIDPNGLDPKYSMEDFQNFLKEKGYNV